MIADETGDQLRLLALVDRAIGLEAEVAQLKISLSTASETSAEVHRLRDEIEQLNRASSELRASRTWRVGATVLRPLQVARRLGSRFGAGSR